MPDPSPPHPRLPPELRALAAIVVFDLIAGVWLALHYPPGLSLFLSQIPVLGLAGAVWGFLPDPQKEAFGAWLAWVLQLKPVYPVLALAAFGLALATFFVATIRVDAVESDVATMLYLVPGSQRDLDTGSRSILDSARLNRLTTPHHFVLRIAPFGRRVWLHTPTHVTGLDVTVKPWIPNRLHYPDAFTPMATVAALVSPLSFPALASEGEARLVLLDLEQDHDTLATATLKADLRGYLLSYTDPGPPAEDVRRRWEAFLAKVFPNDSDRVNITVALEAWTHSHWARTRRPLAGGDSVRWEVRSTRGDSLAAGRLGLSHGVTDLVLVL